MSTVVLTLKLLTALLLLRFLIYPILRAAFDPLRTIPGPLLARFTRLYYLHALSTGNFHHTNRALHKRYGPIVRLAPSTYSLDSPSAIKPIYSVTSNFAKSAWYDGWRHPDPTKNSIFPERDVRRHADTRRLFQGMYSLSALLEYEGYVDECAALFMRRMEEFSRGTTAVNMGHWLQCYAFDVISDITYGARFGFLDAGEDLRGVMKKLWMSMWYSALIGVYAEWHPWVFRWTEKIQGSGAEARTYVLGIVGGMVAKRKNELAGAKAGAEESPDKVDDGNNRKVPRDFLSKIMAAHEADPAKVTAYHVFMMGIANVFAGSDTTAVTLSAVLYYLLTNPRTLARLRAEIEEFERPDRSGTGTGSISFKQAQAMPYLQAVLKEAMRLHAATGLPLWRVVPAGGVQVCGRFFPAGSVVGVNTWVAHYSEEVFGPDAAAFRPERWIEAEGEEGGERKGRMEGYYFPFGLGSRTCLGKHISILEISKLIPALVRRFDFDLPDDDAEGGRVGGGVAATAAKLEWTTENFWFVKPVDFWVRVKLRLTPQGAGERL